MFLLSTINQIGLRLSEFSSEMIFVLHTWRNKTTILQIKSCSTSNVIVRGFLHINLGLHVKNLCCSSTVKIFLCTLKEDTEKYEDLKDLAHNCPISFYSKGTGELSYWVAIILLFFFLAVSCISRKVPEPATNKEEIDGKSQIGIFVSKK